MLNLPEDVGEMVGKEEACSLKETEAGVGKRSEVETSVVGGARTEGSYPL